MDKVLLNKYGEGIIFNTETNAIKGTVGTDIEVRTAFIADAPGQAVSMNEVVDYNAGDIVIVLAKYGSNPKVKVIVATDVIAKDDLIHWFEECKQDETI